MRVNRHSPTKVGGNRGIQKIYFTTNDSSYFFKRHEVFLFFSVPSSVNFVNSVVKIF
jgi:hypothetical protein